MRVMPLKATPEATFQIARAGEAPVMTDRLWANRIPAIVAAAEAVRA